MICMKHGLANTEPACHLCEQETAAAQEGIAPVSVSSTEWLGRCLCCERTARTRNVDLYVIGSAVMAYFEDIAARKAAQDTEPEQRPSVGSEPPLAARKGNE